MELPLDEWLKTILKVANDPSGHPLTMRLRKKLVELMADKLRGHLARRFMHPLPPLFVSLRHERPHVVTTLDPSSETEVEELNREGFVAWMADHYADELEGAIYALSTDPLGHRVRRCDKCQMFFVARRNHRRPHYFCCDDHRRKFDHEHRDPKKQAAYMREHRRVQAERKRKRKQLRGEPLRQQ